ncbi:EAL domain-containing protein [Alkalimarinus sediminis]|uniref:EAL domain-containing protein n=1 Tax=Alkalimarinus sediminis TaxID=1632866 RepID=A0A9E8KNC3_9ALTE|nr:EAL domain-containing protein [Alkalimarinus sediminis]UZW73549.1 EAL domain-containing protein [Alkalimarinus sediminis]
MLSAINTTSDSHNLDIQGIDQTTHALASNEWSASFMGMNLRSAFQPIFSLSHKRIVGYEALVRPFDTKGDPLSPGLLFQQSRNKQENIQLDRACRLLHMKNFKGLPDDLNWLFINVSPETIALNQHNDSFFGRLLEHFNFPPHRVVIEIVEQPTSNSENLAQAVDYYKRLGCLTALDDFGAGHSNFERVWALKPDIVKLDRSMIVRASEEGRIRQMLNGIVSLLHQAGCLVLMEGVETKEQAMIAIDCGVDFVQGFYFALPQVGNNPSPQSTTDLASLLSSYKKDVKDKADPTAAIRDHYFPLFNNAVDKIREGLPLEQAAKSLTEHHTVTRCYMMNKDGIQIGETTTSRQNETAHNQKFKPLENTKSADWFRQHYLRRALSHPNELQITRPYLSVTGAYMCVTLSLLFKSGDQQIVICCDILAD